jgi:hypothetical protein
MAGRVSAAFGLGRGDGGAHPADAPLAVGDGASFSPQVVAGSSRSAKSQVAAVAKASCTTTNSARCRARRTVAWSGRLWAGLVQAIHKALISPSAAAWNISTAVLPGFSGTLAHAPQRGDFGAVRGLARSRWPLSRLAMPPTSRPPMALGWPVSEKGPAPGLPICPVARCRLISAAFLAVPLLDWFRPWQYRLKVGPRWWEWPSMPANQRAAVSRSSLAMPQVCATRSGVQSRTIALRPSKPTVWAR